MTLEEAIKTALEFERKVRDSYQTASNKASDPTARKVLKVFADEEAGHVAYLHARLEEWRKTGHVTSATLNTAIPSRERIAAGVAKLQAGIDRERPTTADLAAFRSALDVEREASGFYKKMVAELPAEGQRLFARFVEIEEGHLAMAQAEIDAANGLGFWFDVQEFRLEAG
jgi:rubrerythrin